MATDVLMCEAGRDLLYAIQGKDHSNFGHSYATADFELLKVRM